MQQHMDHGEQEGGVGLRLDRDPFGRAGAGDRQMRLDLHALHAAAARVGVALDPAHAARGLDIGAERKDIFAERGIGAHGESAVPEFAVQMFGMGALDALTGAEAQIDRAPGREEGRQRAHIGGGRAAAAKAGGKPRKTARVGQAGRARGLELVGDQIERLVPGDAHKARVLVPPLLRVGPFHRIKHAIRAVGLLHQPKGFDAGLAAAGMNCGGGKIRVDLGRHPVLDAHGQQVRPCYALVAIGRNDAFVLWLASRHSRILSPSRGTCLVARARHVRCRCLRWRRRRHRLAHAPNSPP